MIQKYRLEGLHCGGCQKKASAALNQLAAVHSVDIDLATKRVSIEMDSELSISDLQQAFLDKELPYTISDEDANTKPEQTHHHHADTTVKNGNGIFYCPMHCEGDKTYAQLGDCPVCGMDLIEQEQLNKSVQYTCPMHPEIISDNPGPCSICGMDLVAKEPSASADQQAYATLMHKMYIAAGCAILVFLISMGEMIPGNPLPALLSSKTWMWTQFALTLPVVFVCRMFFSRAYRSMLTWNLNMFTLVGIGTGVAFLFSVLGLLFPELFPDAFKTADGNMHLYFEATAVILSLVLFGQLLEARAHQKTSGAIKELLSLTPSETTRVQNGQDQVISIHDVAVGDVLRVKPGERIPVDGTVSDGESNIDESMISGEPIPVRKTIGDTVHSGCINGNQSFLMEARKVGKDTLLAQIIEMVNQASRSRAPIQKLADTIAKYFVPTVVIISILTFIVWAIFGPEPALTYALVNAIAVLIISCPCALGLATPMSIMVGVGKGAQSGILIKNAEALETLHKVNVLITDKTGTITEGRPSVHALHALNGADEAQLLRLSASLSNSSEHPLSAAVIHHAQEQGCELLPVKDFESITGKGIIGNIDGQRVALGNDALLKQLHISIDDTVKELVIAEQKSGKTVSYVSLDQQVIGYVLISDAIKTHSREAIAALIKAGVDVIMMTGDNQHTAAALAGELGLKEFQASCLPEDKLNRVKALQSQGKIVAMAGDGINDSPALAQADVGIAMGTGTDVAMESAEVTLVKGDLTGILTAIKLSHAVMRNIKQNLFFAFVYNALGIPIAAGVLYPFLGILLSPMIAAFAMSLSSVSVILNSLRLRGLRLK